MRIYSLSKIIALPFIVIALVIGYFVFFKDADIAWWLLLPLGALVAIVMGQGDIDYWYLKKNPLPLDPVEKDMITKHVLFYNSLSANDQQKFEDRVSLYIGAREWKNVGTSELVGIPDDVKVLFASQAIQLTFNDDDFLLGDFDRIYTYRHPFPTPKYQFLHTVETDVEDGLILFAMDYALPGMTAPDQYYNIVGHGYADAYINQNKVYPDSVLVWPQIESITGFTKEQILGVLGYKESDVDLLVIQVMCYFTYPEKMKEVSPQGYKDMQNMFKKNTPS